jgi:Xaa-Pro aminopeptidase
MCHQEAQLIVGASKQEDTVDIAPLLWQLRAEKSAAEIEKVERACAVTDQAISDVMSTIPLGISEHDIEMQLIQRMKELGAEQGYLDVGVGADRHLWANNRSRRDRGLRRDDMGYVDGGCCIDGYHCDICRMFSFKRPPDEVLRIFQSVSLSNEITCQSLAGGKAGSEIYTTCKDEMARHGFGDILNTQAVVHSVGLDLHEPPECGPFSQDKLGEQMTVCVEPWSIHPQYGLFNVEDVVAFQGSTTRRLTSMPLGIYCLEEKRWIGID